MVPLTLREKDGEESKRFSIAQYSLAPDNRSGFLLKTASSTFSDGSPSYFCNVRGCSSFQAGSGFFIAFS